MKRFRVEMAPGVYRYKGTRSYARSLAAALGIGFYEVNALGAWVKRKV